MQLSRARRFVRPFLWSVIVVAALLIAFGAVVYFKQHAMIYHPRGYDASYPIRQLEKLDRGIHPAPGFIGAVKRYDNVVIYHLRNGCGRRAMEQSFDEDKAEDRRVSRELGDSTSVH